MCAFLSQSTVARHSCKSVCMLGGVQMLKGKRIGPKEEICGQRDPSSIATVQREPVLKGIILFHLMGQQLLSLLIFKAAVSVQNPECHFPLLPHLLCNSVLYLLSSRAFVFWGKWGKILAYDRLKYPQSKTVLVMYLYGIYQERQCFSPLYMIASKHLFGRVDAFLLADAESSAVLVILILVRHIPVRSGCLKYL